MRKTNLSGFYNTIGWSSLLIAVLTLGSRIVGLLRIRIFASRFGAGPILDTYYASFRIPDFLMGIFIVGTLSLAALPIITQYTVKNKEEGKKLVAKLLNLTFVGMAALCGVTALFAPAIVHLVVPGFSAEAARNVVMLTRIILLAQVILSIANVVSSALNAIRHFFWVGFAPISYNIGLILGAVYFYPRYNMIGLGYGVVFGAVLHTLVLLADFYYVGFRLMPVIKVDSGALAILKLYWPRLLTFDLSLLSLIFASIFGSYLAPGSISVYSLGFDLQAVPVGVIAFAVATASFTHFAEYFVAKDVRAFTELLRASVVRILFYMLPISVVLLLLRSHIVRIIYGAGQFNWEDTRGTFNVLGVLAFSLIGQSLVPLFSRALLARLNTWTPVISNILSILVTICTTVLLVPRLGILGVAWGYVAGVTFGAMFSYFWLRTVLVADKEHAALFTGQEHILVSHASRILFGVLLLAVSTYCTLFLVAPFLNTHTWLGLVVQSLVSLAVGGVIYLFVCYGLNLPDVKIFSDILKKINFKFKS